MSLNIPHPHLEFAVAVVRQAGLLARSVQAELVERALTKQDRSPVTVADFAVQALVGCLLGRAYPGMPLVAEEDSGPLRSESARPTLVQVASFVGRFLAYATPESVCEWIDRGNGKPAPRFWVLDPIDGTKGFLRGDQYVVALALVEGGRVELAALACPNLTDSRRPEPGGPGSLVVAVRGQGAWSAPLEGGEFGRLQVSACSDLSRARVLLSVEAGHTNLERMTALRRELGIESEPVRMDSQAKYAVLAAGGGEILFRLLPKNQPDFRENIWDLASGALVVEEAGGRITDLRGNSLDFGAGVTLARNCGALASNGLLHDAALEALGRLLPG